MAHSWWTEEDFQRDLVLSAEYCVPDPNRKPEPVPDTILRFRAQMEKNRQSSLTDDINQNAMYVISGRGKGIKDRIARPGDAFPTHPNDDIELSKQIRETVGEGFSNQLIETNLAARRENSENSLNTYSDIDETFRFEPAITISSSSSQCKSSSSSDDDVIFKSETVPPPIRKKRTVQY